MEFKSKQAIYLQIADYLCEFIINQTWRAGDKFPAIRELAAELAVNPNTITRTYAHLEQQGIIATKRGVGYFITEDGFQKTRALIQAAFVKTQLPEVFKTMKLLQFSIDDFTRYYQKEFANEEK